MFLVFFFIIACALIAACFRVKQLTKDLQAERSKADEFEVLYNQSEALISQRRALASEVAHEIKNPITAILCSAEALDLLIGSTLEAEHRKTLRYIKEYGDYLLRLVGDFLDLNMVESGKLSAKPEPVYLKDVLASITGLLESTASRKQININYECTDSHLQAFADPKHLRQVLFNLVHNAIKYSQEDSDVRVFAREDYPSPQVLIEVQDFGPGISRDKLDKLFDPYYRVDPNKGDGAGLGLSLARALVDLAGGTIEARSEEGRGSVFEIRLPIHRSGAKKQKRKRIDVSPASQRPLLGQSFLLVDNDRASREALACLIEAWGGLVDNVTDATQAVSALSYKQYDGVMIDATPETLSSLELVQKIRAEDPESCTTIILTSNGEISAKDLDAAPADLKLQKPLNGKRLLESLLSAMRCQITH